MFSYLRSLAIDTEALLSSLGLSGAELMAPDSRLPIERYARIEEAAARAAGDPYFGLHMGEFAEAGSWSILGYMMMNCRSVAEAIEKSTRYCRVIGNFIVSEPSFEDGRIRVLVSTAPGAPGLGRHCIECSLSSTVTMLRRLSGLEISPLEVRLAYPEPESRREYERVFRCPLHFGQSESSIVLDPAIGALPVVYANPGLLERIEGYAVEFLSGIDEGAAASRAVTRLILSGLADESLSLATVARGLSMSVRTLQQRLAKEGNSFGALLDDSRSRLAKRYLREGRSVEEVTCLLGFSDPSVLRRAFKKWTGLTPGEFRATRASRVPAEQVRDPGGD